jgi:hypothetical protein
MGWRAEARLTSKAVKCSQKGHASLAKVDIATPHKKEIIMKLLAFLGFISIFTTRRPNHGAVVVLVQQHGADSSSRATPLDVELCKGDKIVYDELTFLLADHGARPESGPAVGQPGKGAAGPSYGGTDHRAKYYRKYVRK